MTSQLADKILRERPNGFVGAIVEGPRSIGKSSYCLKVGRDVYKAIHPELTDYEAYDMTLNYCLFDVDDVLRVLKETRKKREILPYVVWDDAGAFASSLLWFINLEQVHQLKSVMDTIRTAVTGFVINCPDRSSLLKNLRSYDDYVVNIVKWHGGHARDDISKTTGQPYKNYQRVARGYTTFKIPDGRRMIHKNFEDEFSCYLPDDIYKKYMNKRNSYLDKAVDIMEETKTNRLSNKVRKKIQDKILDVELSKKVEKLKEEGIHLKD